MKRDGQRFHQWSTISSISTKQTITSHVNSLNIKKAMPYAVGNTVPGYGQAL